MRLAIALLLFAALPVPLNAIVAICVYLALRRFDIDSRCRPQLDLTKDYEEYKKWNHTKP